MPPLHLYRRCAQGFCAHRPVCPRPVRPRPTSQHRSSRGHPTQVDAPAPLATEYRESFFLLVPDQQQRGREGQEADGSNGSNGSYASALEDSLDSPVASVATPRAAAARVAAAPGPGAAPAAGPAEERPVESRSPVRHDQRPRGEAARGRARGGIGPAAESRSQARCPGKQVTTPLARRPWPGAPGARSEAKLPPPRPLSGPREMRWRLGN